MSDTPRTDAATRMAFSGEYMLPIQDAQKLERELNEARKQRNALAEALAEVRAFGYRSTKERLSLFINKALAATKGGIDE